MRLTRQSLSSHLYLWALLMLATPSMVLAQETPDDLSALALADKPQTPVEAPSNWRIFAEGATGLSAQRYGLSTQDNERLSLDVRYDKSFATYWRAVIADRFDASWPAQTGYQTSINTLKEAYLSWQASPTEVIDVGRINIRNGVALGYNPTDYFKANAVRSVVSVDPTSLKENRQGSVILSSQTLWDQGALTALYSPRLERNASYAPFDLNLGATNSQNRFLISATQKLANGITPQLHLFKNEQASPQLGFNLTALVNDATVVYTEWSGGRSSSQLSQALRQQGMPSTDDMQFRNRFSGGVTYTTENKLSLTAELEYNGAGLNKQQIQTLSARAGLPYRIYLNGVQGAQDNPNKWAAFMYASWKDALMANLDLTAMARLDLVDNSRMFWLEARYHNVRNEFALQWQRNIGTPLSTYGVIPQSQSIQLVARQYF